MLRDGVGGLDSPPALLTYEKAKFENFNQKKASAKNL